MKYTITNNASRGRAFREAGKLTVVPAGASAVVDTDLTSEQIAAFGRQGVVVEPVAQAVTAADVPGMTDVEALRGLASGDKRSAVVKAAIARLEEIEAE